MEKHLDPRDRATADCKERVMGCIWGHVRLHPLNGVSVGFLHKMGRKQLALLCPRGICGWAKQKPGHLLRTGCEVSLPSRTNPAKSSVRVCLGALWWVWFDFLLWLLFSKNQTLNQRAGFRTHIFFSKSWLSCSVKIKAPRPAFSGFQMELWKHISKNF
jgi:hypothetical protein